MLGQGFTPDELGRIEKMELDRRRLSGNGIDVFSRYILDLKKEKKTDGDGGDPFAELMRLREKARKSKNEKKAPNT